MQSRAQIQGTLFPVWIGLIWANAIIVSNDKPSMQTVCSGCLPSLRWQTSLT